ncbi:MAG: DUF2490 domain-containing protein [Bacteroidota bacterium]
MKYRKLITLFFLFFAFTARAQVKDAGLWTTLSVEKDFSKKISMSIDEEMRLIENCSRIDLFYTNFGMTYKFNKQIRVGFTYRLTEKKQDNNMFSIRNRLMLDLTYKRKFYGFIFQYRSRIQSEIRNYYSSETGKIPSWDWRNKFEVKYDKDQFVPYAGTELFLQLNDPNDPETNRMMPQIRCFAGMDYKINQNNTLGMYGLINKEINVSNPVTTYIFGIQYAIQF